LDNPDIVVSCVDAAHVLMCGYEMCSYTGMETEVRRVRTQRTHTMSLHGLKDLDS